MDEGTTPEDVVIRAMEAAAAATGWRTCIGCGLQLPESSAFFPGLGPTCRLCRGVGLADIPASAEPPQAPEEALGDAEPAIPA